MVISKEKFFINLLSGWQLLEIVYFTTSYCMLNNKHIIFLIFMARTLWVRISFMARCTRYNIMWQCLSVTCGRSVVFSGYFRFLHQQIWPARYNWNIFESGVKHNNPLTPQATARDSIFYNVIQRVNTKHMLFLLFMGVKMSFYLDILSYTSLTLSWKLKWCLINCNVSLKIRLYIYYLIL